MSPQSWPGPPQLGGLGGGCYVSARINAAMVPIIDYQQLAADQAAFAEIDAYRTAITSLVLQDVPYQNVTFLCDVSRGKHRPIIPLEWTHRIFEAMHSLTHSGP